VCFVDGEQCEPAGVAQMVELVEKARRHQALGRDVEQV